MQDAFSRMELLVGNTGVKKLSRAKIAVFGLGGASVRQWICWRASPRWSTAWWA